MEKFIETKEDLQLVETELKDYENLSCLVNIIKTIFQTLANKIDLKIMQNYTKTNKHRKYESKQETNSTRSVRTEEEYEKLE